MMPNEQIVTDFSQIGENIFDNFNYSANFNDGSSKLYWTLTILSIVITVIYYHYVKFTYWSSRGIKGPMPVPFFGTEFYYIFKNRIDLESQWRQQFGRTYGIYSGYVPALITTDNEFVKRIFIKDFDHFTNRVPITVTAIQKRFLFWSRDADWSRKRAIVSPSFTSRRMRQMFELMRVCTGKLMTELDRATCDGKRSAIISKDIFMCLSADVIAKACFATDLNTYRDRDSNFAKRAFAFSEFDYSRVAGIILLPKLIRKWLNYDLISFDKLEFFNEVSKKLIANRRAAQESRSYDNTNTSPPDDMLQVMMEAERTADIHLGKDDSKEAHYNSLSIDQIRQEQRRQYETSVNSKKKLTDEELCGQMIFFFIAGFETTSTTISFCAYELANNQQVQELVYKELMENIKTIQLDSVDYGQVLELKYLDAFVSEVMRLYAPVTVIDRETGKDYYISDDDGILPEQVTLEKGTFVRVPFYVLHHDKEYWPNPEQFDISRFLPENRDKIKTCTYAPFGLGPRHCVGMRFALVEIKLALTQLIIKYKFMRAKSSDAYPPKFNRHLFFLQLKNSDVLIEQRKAAKF